MPLPVLAPRLSSVILIRRFPREDMRRKQFDFEDLFASYIHATSQSLPTSPEAAPAQPRFIISDTKRTLVVSNVTVQLTLDFGASFPAKSTFKSVLSRPAELMDKMAEQLLSHQRRAYSAIVVEWVCPKKGDLESLSRELAALNLKPQFPDPIAFYTASIGLRSGEFYKTVELAVYKRFQTPPPGLGGLHLDLDFDDDPVPEEGLQIKVDANTKPQMDRPPKSAFAALIPVLQSAVEQDLAPLIGSDLVDGLKPK